MFIFDDDLNPVQPQQSMPFNPNTFSSDFFLFDNPSDPIFSVPSKLDPIFSDTSTFIKPPPLPPSSPPPQTHQYVHQRIPSPTVNGGGHQGASPYEAPLLSQQHLLNLDLEWFDTHSSTPVAASAPVPATSAKDVASGFDQLSPFEVCASAFNTPFTPHLDTPEPTPSQTPLFDCVASEDFDAAALELFWNPSPVQDSSLTPLSGQGQVQQDINSRLQAETALLDFVLFDDIAPPSPISTLTTPLTASLSSPSHDQKDVDTQALAMQLVASAAANMASQSGASSSLSTPLVSDSSTVIGSLFSEVDLSPFMDAVPAAPLAPADPSIQLDWTPAFMYQDLSLDLASNLDSFNHSSALGASNGWGMSSSSSSPSLPLTTSISPEMDLSLLLSLYGHQSSMPPVSNQAVSKGPSTENPLKRKSDEIQPNGEESPRQFACALCGRAFSRLFNLNTHERTHDRSKARLFACPEQGCKKSFTRKNDLQRHQVSIHKVTLLPSRKSKSKGQDTATMEITSTSAQ